VQAWCTLIYCYKEQPSPNMICPPNKAKGMQPTYGWNDIALRDWQDLKIHSVQDNH